MRRLPCSCGAKYQLTPTNPTTICVKAMNAAMTHRMPKKCSTNMCRIVSLNWTVRAMPPGTFGTLTGTTSPIEKRNTDTTTQSSTATAVSKVVTRGTSTTPGEAATAWPVSINTFTAKRTRGNKKIDKMQLRTATAKTAKLP